MVRTGSTLTEAISQAKAEAQTRQEIGFCQASLNKAAAEGLSLGAFEESVEEGAAVVEEFYPSQVIGAGGDAPSDGVSASLLGKLQDKAAKVSIAQPVS